VLEEQTLPNLQKVADRLGVRVSKGLTGLLTQAMLGPVPESRRSYIEALANSDLVTLEEIDRILHTHYARLPDDTRGVGWRPKPRGGLAGVFMTPRADTRVERFFTLDSLLSHILHSYVAKSDLQKLCQNLGLPGTGNKSDLENRILGDQTLTNAKVLYFINRNNMKKLCQDMNLPAIGTRQEMESRVANVMWRLPRATPIAPSYEPPRYASPTAQPPPDATTPLHEPLPQYAATKEPPILAPEDIVPPPPPGPPIPPRPDLDSVIEFLREFSPSQRFKDEILYEVELAQALRHRFKNVKTEANVPGGRIDIEVMGIGVEIKVPNSRAHLQRLVGQMIGYRSYYGPNVVAMIFPNLAKLQDVNEFRNSLMTAGITVIVK